jgi:hypothetical protein
MPLAKLIDGHKFMWDGVEYGKEDEARQAMATYQASGFETALQYEDNRAHVYTRKVVTEVHVESSQ